MQKQVEFSQAITRKYPEQVVLVTTRGSDGKANVMAVGWVTLASGEPPMFVLGIDDGARTYELIRQTGQFVVAFPSEQMAGQTLFAVIYSLLFTGVILLVTAVIFEIDLSSANLWGGTLMLIAGSLSFIGVGIMGSILPMLFPERGSQMTHVIIAILLLVSGVYYPVEVLPAVLQKLAVISPATYVLDGTRRAMLEGAPTSTLWPYIWPTLLMLVLFFVLFYFLLIRPQNKRMEEHKKMVNALAKGDEVITNGGLLGRIEDVGESFVTIELAPNVSVKLQKQAVQAIVPKGTIKSA